MRHLATVALSISACTIPPPTMLAPLDSASPVSGGDVTFVAHGGGAVVPDTGTPPSLAAGADLEVGINDNIAVALGGGLQNQGVVGQVAVRARVGGDGTEGWTVQFQVGVGGAALLDNTWFTATPAVGAHLGIAGSAPISKTGRGYLGSMFNLSVGLDEDGIITPFSYIGGGFEWSIPSDDHTEVIFGTQLYALGIVIPVSPGVAVELGIRFGTGAD